MAGLREALGSKGVRLPPRHLPKLQLWNALAAHPADPTGAVAGWAAECAELQAAEEEFAAAAKAKATAKAAAEKATERAWKERAAVKAGAAGEVGVNSEAAGGAEMMTGVTAAAKTNSAVQQRMDEYQKLARRWCVLSARPLPGQRRPVCMADMRGRLGSPGASGWRRRRDARGDAR